LIHLVAHGNAKPDEYTQPLVAEARRMENRLPALLYHDDLSPINDPVYFHEFADHAARHKLQFLAEATFVSSSYAGIAPEARGVLAALDPITRQQYLDFIKCRRFRESLLCRSEVAVNRDETPERMRSLAFTAARRVRPAQNGGQTSGATPEPLTSADDDVDVKYMRALLDTLRKATPHALALDALLDQLRSHPDAARQPGGTSVEPERILLASLQAGIIDPHVSTPRYAYPPGDRPTASAVVRSQLGNGDIVTSLWHQPVKVDDEIARRLLPLLDGTRNRRALVAATADFIAASGGSSTTAVDGHLRRLAKLGLLIA
jgi:Predicted methyltransferase regulatory domain